MTEQTAQDGLPTGVSLTAVGVAVVRAMESRRADRLFDDPLAEAFTAALGGGRPQVLGGAPERTFVDGLAYIHDHVAIRTRFFDDYLDAAATAGCRQAVLLAAGLDTRAFRLAWPRDTRVFEVDLPDLVRFKERVLCTAGATARATRVVLPADLRGDWASTLLSAGFDPERPSAWLLEGLLPYLSEADNDRLLTEIGRLSAAGSRIALQHMGRSRTSHAVMREALNGLRRIGVSLLSTMDEPGGWLGTHGWCAEVFRPAELGPRYGRQVAAGEAVHSSWLARAELAG